MEAELFFKNALYAGYIALIISFVVGVARFRQLNNDQKLLFVLITLALLIELTGRILWHLRINNLFLYHFYSVAEFVLLGVLYVRHLDGLIESVYIRFILAVFVLFALVNTLFFQSLQQFNSHVTFAESLLLIIFSILYFYKELRDLENRNLDRVPMFWINTAVITYFSGALVLFHVANDLIPESMKVKGVVWGIHALFNIVHYTLFAIALWIRAINKTSIE